jgi:hypothetical protein
LLLPSLEAFEVVLVNDCGHRVEVKVSSRKSMWLADAVNTVGYIR